MRRTLKSLVGRTCYPLEMKAIAQRANMDLGRLVLLQHIYEACACCTSIVLEGENCPIHIRSMDWGMDILKPLTIEIDCRKNDQTVFLATTWAGYLGVFTGMRPGEWSCSLNFRVTRQGSFWTNLKSAMKGAMPSGFLIRQLLETEPSFDGAMEALASTPLIAPCYFSICGAQPGQGALITRHSSGEEHRLLLSEQGYFVQTNIDHWSDESSEDIMMSIRRKQIAQKHLQKRPSPITYDWLWKLLSTSPILNDITIYGTLMVPGESKLLSRLPHAWFGYHPLSLSEPVPGNTLVPANACYAEYVSLVTVAPIERMMCSVCHKKYGPYKNPTGECTHSGVWHATIADCSVLKCGVGLLPFNIGLQHWSCCYSTLQDSTLCTASPQHVVQPTTDD